MKRDVQGNLSILAHAASYVCFGALICSLCGTALISASVACVGWIFDHLPYSNQTHVNDGPALGGFLGCVSGGVMGSLVFGILCLVSARPRPYVPTKAALSKVAIAMAAATFGFMAVFFVSVEVIARNRHLFFVKLIEVTLHNSHYLTLGLPAVMMCGQIVGGIWSFRSEKVAMDAPVPWL
jgi:hypothetical protein